MDVRLGAVVLVVSLQLVQFAAAFGAPKTGPCCCHGTTCPMKMHCAKTSCELRERPAAMTVVRAIAPAIVVTAVPPVNFAQRIAVVATTSDGFTRTPDQPPRFFRIVS